MQHWLQYQRFWALIVVVLGCFIGLLSHIVFDTSIWWFIISLLLVGVGVYDYFLQRNHAVLRNYPIIGHFRYLIEMVRPELRQYLVESDTDKVPFSRDERSVVYQRAKGLSDVKPFGTKLDVMSLGHEWLTHSMQPSILHHHDFRITVGAERQQAYSLSVFNISAMSFGALSANAIRALNLGAHLGNFAHDTGEGSVSLYHLEHGGDLIWQVASGYFGCRTEAGQFDPDKFKKTAALPSIKMIEIKLSQGAKPGHGGVLPASKVTPEIAQTRGVPLGQDCVSPAAHSAFSTPTELLQFIEKLRELSGDKPVGLKLCVGQPWEFLAIAKAMILHDIYPDFIVVDGAEGGTGAAPIEFADRIGTPLQDGLLFIHNTLVGLDIRGRIKIGVSGKVITAFDMARLFALGADWINSARGFMFSLGCIQALNCHSGFCPTGITTQDPERQKGLDVETKSRRVMNFHHHTLVALKELLQSLGLTHPNQITADHIVRRLSSQEIAPLSEVFFFAKPGELLAGERLHSVYQKWWDKVTPDSFSLGPK